MKRGDKIYCHTTGYFNGSTDDKDIFAISGKHYTVTKTNPYHNGFTILNERGSADHSWSLSELFYEHFSLTSGLPIPIRTVSKHKF